MRTFVSSFAPFFVALACVSTPQPTTAPSMRESPAQTPVTAAPEPAPSGWWCFAGRYPGASRTSSRCVRGEGECNRRHAQRQGEGYVAETPQCIRMDRAQCTAFPNGTALCMTNAEHCEATRRVFSGRPGDPQRSKVPPCSERP